MNALLVFLFFYLQSFQQTSIKNISEIRRLYSVAALQKDSAGRLAELLLPVDTATALPLLLCYKGANEMITAKYVVSPIAKLNRFKKGKIWIENAISRDTLATEMRYLRFSIQTNLPSFLGYQNNIIADKLFLLNQIDKTKDQELKKMMLNYLLLSKYVTEEERKKLRY